MGRGKPVKAVTSNYNLQDEITEAEKPVPKDEVEDNDTLDKVMTCQNKTEGMIGGTLLA